MGINPDHLKMLRESAISDDVIAASGIESREDGLYFPWNDGVGETVWQARPDRPRLNEDGEPVKYEFPQGTKVPFNRLRDAGADASRMILAEGTKQSYAVLSHAPADMAVYGMAGCWGFKNADTTVAAGRDVYVMLDADVESNVQVWSAAEALTKKLKRAGAKSVNHVFTTGEDKDGVDDVLARLSPDKRADTLRTWLSAASTSLPRKPKAKRPTLSETDAEAVKLFGQREKQLSYKPVDGAARVLDMSPAAITAEKNIALYRSGVYVVDEDALLSVVVSMLGNFYTPAFLTQTEHALRARLKDAGHILPERMPEPLFNVKNGMVDLRTGELTDHDPKYLSYVQSPVSYIEGMATPVYDAWIRQALRQEGHTDADVEALVRDIEETAGTMLDPTRTPSKALFLFGPSRSGKSTFLRLLKAVAGSENTSAVTLQALGKDTFATANLYGKMLNVAADLSNEHVGDLSNFKMATGEDVLNANRKYGKQFTFTNQALFAFSANELPTVSEASRAYAERMKPFEFPNSFAGREDKHLEDKLVAELPGILAKWVSAYGRWLARGGYAPTDRATQTTFEAKSDRVVQFFQDMVTVTEATYGQRLPAEAATGRRDTAMAFNAWAERNGGSKMGERAFFQRFSQIPGVTEVRVGSGNKAFNVVVAKVDDDNWTEPEQPVSDPVASSGVTEAADGPETASDVSVGAWAAARETGPQTGAESFELAASGQPRDTVTMDPFADEDLGYKFFG